jgi:acylphosphatase
MSAATLQRKKEKTLLDSLLKRSGSMDEDTVQPSTQVFPGSEIGKVQPIGEAREKTSLTPVPTQSVGSQPKQPSIALPQSSKNMSNNQSHVAARESGAPLHTKEPTQSFSKLPKGNISEPFSKMAGTYTYKMEGNVQGVGLRKALHSILEENQLRGLAVNYPEKNEVYATIQGRKKKIDAILKMLQDRLAVREKKPLLYSKDYSITHVPEIKEKMKNVVFTRNDISNFERNNPELDKFRLADTDKKIKYFEDRYRLHKDSTGNLVGKLPDKAIGQLLHGDPVYHRQILDRAQKTAEESFFLGFVKKAYAYGLTEQAILKLAYIDKEAGGFATLAKTLGGRNNNTPQQPQIPQDVQTTYDRVPTDSGSYLAQAQ